MVLLKANETLISYTRNTVIIDASRQIENYLRNTITNDILYVKQHVQKKNQKNEHIQ